MVEARHVSWAAQLSGSNARAERLTSRLQIGGVRMEQDETELLGQVVAGDRLALQRLLISCQTRLMARIKQGLPAELGRVISAEDILQETYIDVFRNIKDFRNTNMGTFFTWLTAIADNRLRDNLRAQNAAKRGGGRRRIETTAGSSIAPLLEILLADTHTPSRSVALHEFRSVVGIALAGLKTEYREALQLRFLNGLSAAEVAARMDRSVWSIHKLCSRGLQQMRESMGDASKFLSSR